MGPKSEKPGHCMKGTFHQKTMTSEFLSNNHLYHPICDETVFGKWFLYFLIKFQADVSESPIHKVQEVLFGYVKVWHVQVHIHGKT